MRKFLAVVALAALTAVLVAAVQSQAQQLSTQLIADYLDRYVRGQSGVTWRRSSSDTSLFYATRTGGLKRADKIEIVVSVDTKNDEVDLLAYPQVGGKYLAESAVRDKAGLERQMLRNNAGAFGGYFLDKDFDFGFKYVFTTESGLGYDAFKTVLDELFRIADDPMVKLYDSFR